MEAPPVPDYGLIVRRQEITDATASAFSGVGEIPEKYVQTVDVLGCVVDDDESYELPAIDMARLLDPESSGTEIAKLGAACRDLGFFHLTNHGVDAAAVEQIKQSIQQFFSLPLEGKKTVTVQGNSFDGYGHHFSGVSEKLDWAESLYLVTQPVQNRNLARWPLDPPTFRDALDSYSTEVASLRRRLLRFMAAELGVEQEALQDAFSGKRQSVAIHHYPPCPLREKAIGIQSHTDSPGLTLLLHVDDTPGLQIRNGGRWFPVRPVPGALAFNVGDALEVLTNGAYRSVEHRVIPDAERGRITVVMFQYAAIGEGMLAPLPELLQEDGEARYKSMKQEQYQEGYFKAAVQGTHDFLDSLKIY